MNLYSILVYIEHNGDESPTDYYIANLKHSLIGYWNLDTLESKSEMRGKF